MFLDSRLGGIRRPSFGIATFSLVKAKRIQSIGSSISRIRQPSLGSLPSDRDRSNRNGPKSSKKHLYVTNSHNNRSSVNQMLEHLDWKSLEQRRKDARLTMMYEITNEKVAIPKEGRLIPPKRLSSAMT
jgi:hypothetical protein